MDMGLQGKNVLITGGTRGIGAATVQAYLAEGANVSFCARNKQQVEECLEAFSSVGPGRVIGGTVDVRDTQTYLNWIDQSAEILGGIDVFVPNVTGGTEPGLKGWSNAFDVDLMATVQGCEKVMPYLSESDVGSIVIVASISGIECTGAPSAYNTVKAGLIAYSGQLSEVAGQVGVRVNAVSPGPIHVDDGFWGKVKAAQPEQYKMVSARHAANRLGTTAEVASTIVFLSSPSASWVTGTNLIVDGGFTKRVQY